MTALFERRQLVGVLRALHAGANAAARELRQPPPVAPPAIEPPAPARGSSLAAQVLARGLLPACACFWLVVLNADVVIPTAWLPWYRLASAAVMIPIGSLLVLRQRSEQCRPYSAPLAPLWSHRVKHLVRGRWALAVARVLELLGWAILGAGVYELVLGVAHFV